MRESSSEVSSEIWQEWILEAIRKIRSQKQRPSIQRICQAIGSHHKFHEDIVAGKLEEAVKNGTLIKVYNKGLHSYKAPLARKSVSISKETDISRLVVKAVRELGECDGSNIKSIESYVQKSNNIQLAPDTDFKVIVKNSLKIAVEKEFLIQEGKYYKVGKVAITSPRKRRSTSPRKNPVAGTQQTNNNNNNNNSNNKNNAGTSGSCSNAGGSSTTGGGNSKSGTNNESSSSINVSNTITTTNSDDSKNIGFSSVKASKTATCMKCHGNATNGPTGIPEVLSSCSGCGLSLHSSCASKLANLSTQIPLSTLVKKGSKWLCNNCQRACGACKNSSNINKGICLLTCYNCDKNYHLCCLDPVPEKKPKCPWRCRHCSEHHENVLEKSSSRKSTNSRLVRQKNSKSVERTTDKKKQLRLDAMLQSTTSTPALHSATRTAEHGSQQSIGNQLITSTPLQNTKVHSKKSMSVRRRIIPAKLSSSLTTNRHKNDDDDDNDDNFDDRNLKTLPGKKHFSQITTSKVRQIANSVRSKTEQMTSNSIRSASKKSLLNDNNISEDHIRREQQQLGKSDSMSKEKQKFFRHSAFNSDRVSKQTSQSSSKSQRYRSHLDSQSLSMLQHNDIQSKMFSLSDNVAVDNFNLSRLDSSSHLKCLSDSFDSSDSDNDSDESDDDDQDEDNDDSDESDDNDDEDSDESDDSDDNDDDDDEDDDNSNYKTKKKNGSLSDSYDTLTSNDDCVPKKSAYSFLQSQIDQHIKRVPQWGFAAEASKVSDIFQMSSNNTNERVFGTFDKINDNLIAKATTFTRNSGINKQPEFGGVLGKFDQSKSVRNIGRFESSSCFDKKRTKRKIPWAVDKFQKSDIIKSESTRIHPKCGSSTVSTSAIPSVQINNTIVSNNKNLNNNNNCKSNNNNNNSSSSSTKAPRRIALLSLPLDPKNIHYNSSSEDEIPYLTQHSSSKHSNRSVVIQQSESHLSDKNKLDTFDFASHRDTGGLSNLTKMSSLSPHSPPYNKNQLMGKTLHYIAINDCRFKQTNKK